MLGTSTTVWLRLRLEPLCRLVWLGSGKCVRAVGAIKLKGEIRLSEYFFPFILSTSRILQIFLERKRSQLL